MFTTQNEQNIDTKKQKAFQVTNDAFHAVKKWRKHQLQHVLKLYRREGKPIAETMVRQLEVFRAKYMRGCGKNGEKTKN